MQTDSDQLLSEDEIVVLDQFDEEVEALAEDRRSLSNEIVKLNEELTESRIELASVKEQLFDLVRPAVFLHLNAIFIPLSL